MLFLKDTDLNELLQFAHVNFRGPERDHLTQWLQKKIDAQQSVVPRSMGNGAAGAAGGVERIPIEAPAG